MWGIHYSNNNNNNTSNITIQLNRNSSGETYSCYDVVVAVVVVSRRLFTVLRVCVHDSLEWQQLVANSVRGLPHTYTYITKSVSMFLPRLYEVKSNLGGLDDGADWRIYNIGISRMQMKTFRARRADTGATVLVLWVVLLTHTHRHAHTNTHTIMLTRFAWKINSAIRLRLQRLDSFLKLFGSKMKNCTRHALISYNTCTHTHTNV